MIKRYANPEISSVWDLESKYRYWLQVELAACKIRHRHGAIPEKDMEEILSKAKFDVKRIDEIEKEVQHDMIAFLTNLRENIGPASRHIHYGLTSSDIGDTALCLQLKKSTEILLERLEALMLVVEKKAKKYKKQVVIGRTHGIHGEPTTLGLKFTLFYSELQRNKKRLLSAGEEISVGKFSGAVGTFSSLTPEIEVEICNELSLAFDPISTQVISRDRHAYYCSILGILAGTLEHMAQEIRLLQKTESRELEEPFAKGQKGSSAMPHKRNPVICEKICGLARVIQANVQVAYRNMPLWHERDISHSSAERVVLPDSIIALEYILTKMNYVLSNIHVYPENMQTVLESTRGLFFSQRVLLALVKKGLGREEAYACIQALSMSVWADAKKNLQDELKQDSTIQKYLNHKEIDELFQINYYLRHVDKIYDRVF